MIVPVSTAVMLRDGNRTRDGSSSVVQWPEQAALESRLSNRYGERRFHGKSADLDLIRFLNLDRTAKH